MSGRDFTKDPSVKKSISLLQIVPTLSVPQVMGALKFTPATSIQYGHFFWRLDIYLDGGKSNSKMDIVIWPPESEYIMILHHNNE